MGIEVRPAAGRWDDFASFMVPRKPGGRGCVCIAYRNSSLDMPGRIAHMRALCATEPGPGVLVYVDGEVAGWWGSMVRSLRGSGTGVGEREACPMRVPLPRLSVVHLRHRRMVLAVLVAAAIVLELAAGVGLAYVAGWCQVRAVLGDFDGIWLIALVGALLTLVFHEAWLLSGAPKRKNAPELGRCGVSKSVSVQFKEHFLRERHRMVARS